MTYYTESCDVSTCRGIVGEDGDFKSDEGKTKEAMCLGSVKSRAVVKKAITESCLNHRSFE